MNSTPRSLMNGMSLRNGMDWVMGSLCFKSYTIIVRQPEACSNEKSVEGDLRSRTAGWSACRLRSLLCDENRRYPRASAGFDELRIDAAGARRWGADLPVPRRQGRRRARRMAAEGTRSGTVRSWQQDRKALCGSDLGGDGRQQSDRRGCCQSQ